MRISQREAQRLRKRVAELERRDRERFQAWTKEYPDGVHLDTVALTSVEHAQFRTAAKLGFALVGKLDGENIMIYAVKP